MLLVYNYVLLKMSTWYSKHVEESNNIWRINNIQCITLVVFYGQFMMHGQRNIKLSDNIYRPYLCLSLLNYCLQETPTDLNLKASSFLPQSAFRSSIQSSRFQHLSGSICVCLMPTRKQSFKTKIYAYIYAYIYTCIGMYKVKVKVKVTLEQATKAQRGSSATALFFL